MDFDNTGDPTARRRWEPQAQHARDAEILRLSRAGDSQRGIAKRLRVSLGSAARTPSRAEAARTEAQRRAGRRAHSVRRRHGGRRRADCRRNQGARRPSVLPTSPSPARPPGSECVGASGRSGLPAPGAPAAHVPHLPGRRELASGCRSRAVRRLGHRSRGRRVVTTNESLENVLKTAPMQRLRSSNLVRGTGIESVTACQTARTLSPNLLSPNLCGAVDAR
jgi:hypothetical protein